jgi:hypothetical protein
MVEIFPSVQSPDQFNADEPPSGPELEADRLLEREHIAMTRIYGNANDFDDVSTDHRIRLWVTLIFATLMVALTAYVLGFALLGQGGNASAHRSAAAAMHSRS